MSSKAAALPEPKDDNEPSMEEILASIRKIIADDTLGTKKDEPQPKKPVAEKAPEPEPEPVMIDDPVEVDEDADVLDLAQVATVASKPEEVAVAQSAGDGVPEMMFEASDVDIEAADVNSMAGVPVDIAPRHAASPAPVNNVAALEDRILSDNTGSLVNQAFQTLARQTPMPAIGRSLEDVVAELLRPMLRGWLDDHLPGIVEKLVRAEIERVARG